jgi:hypothetical protein
MLDEIRFRLWLLNELLPFFILIFYERSMMVTRGENRAELVGNDPYHFYFYRNHTRYQSTMLIKCQLHARHDYDYDMRTPLFAAYFIYRLTVTLLEYYCFFLQQPRKKNHYTSPLLFGKNITIFFYWSSNDHTTGSFGVSFI